MNQLNNGHFMVNYDGNGLLFGLMQIVCIVDGDLIDTVFCQSQNGFGLGPIQLFFLTVDGDHRLDAASQIMIVQILIQADCQTVVFLGGVVDTVLNQFDLRSQGDDRLLMVNHDGDGLGFCLAQVVLVVDFDLIDTVFCQSQNGFGLGPIQLFFLTVDGDHRLDAAGQIVIVQIIRQADLQTVIFLSRVVNVVLNQINLRSQGDNRLLMIYHDGD